MLKRDIYRPYTYPPPGDKWIPWGDKQLDLAFAGATKNMSADKQREQRQEELRKMHRDRLDKMGLTTIKYVPHYNIADGPDQPAIEDYQSAAGEEEEVEEYFPIEDEPPPPPSTTSKIASGAKHVVKNYAWPFTRDILGPAALDTAVATGRLSAEAAWLLGRGALMALQYQHSQGDQGSSTQIEEHPPPEKLEEEHENAGVGNSSSSSSSSSWMRRRIRDEPEITGMNINRSTDMNFWREQSAREMRSQLNMRHPNSVGNWAFKSRANLLRIIESEIDRGSW